MATLFFNNCQVLIAKDSGWIDTKFEDGTEVSTVPYDDIVTRYRSEELGYGQNFAKMVWDNQILHTFLSEKIGLPYSPCLWSIAHNFSGDGCVSFDEQYKEEALVLSYQKYINTKKIEPPLEEFIGVYHLKLRPINKEFQLLTNF